MLKVSNVSKTFNPGTVYEKVALTAWTSCSTRAIVTVIGGNGAGKSTLLNCVAGRIPRRQRNGLHRQRRRHQTARTRARFLRVFQDPMMGTAASMGLEENLALAHRVARGAPFAGAYPTRSAPITGNSSKRWNWGWRDRLGTKAGLPLRRPEARRSPCRWRR